DEQQRPTTHPDGVPSVWFNEEGQPAAFGHYEDGNPSGTWAWTDAESGTFASDRAEMSAEGPVPGTQQHRESPEDGWTTVGEERGPVSSGRRVTCRGGRSRGRWAWAPRRRRRSRARRRGRGVTRRHPRCLTPPGRREARDCTEEPCNHVTTCGV